MHIKKETKNFRGGESVGNYRVMSRSLRDFVMSRYCSSGDPAQVFVV